MKKPSPNVLRTLSAVAVVAVVCLGLAVHTGFGTPSSWGFYDVAALCPLGAVEAAIASKTIVPPMLIGLGVVVVLVVVFGRAFCAWGCPVPLLRRIFGLKGRGKAKKPGALDIPDRQRGGVKDTRNWVLGGTILSTALFGFPVFCLVCPVGLTFGTVIALWRLFQFDETTLSLVVFPAILVVEVVVMRKWCHRFCPLGALFSLIGRLNRTFQPAVKRDACLHEKGESCHRCAEVCPEGIDLHDGSVSAPMSECTRCGECSSKCPVNAIEFPALRSKQGRNDSRNVR